MDANRFFSVSMDIQASHKLQALSIMQEERGAGRMECLGRWVALLALLYDCDGSIQMDDAVSARLVENRLDLDREGIFSFLDDCARACLIDQDVWETTQMVKSKSVNDQIKYRETKSKAGSKGSKSRMKKAPA